MTTVLVYWFASPTPGELSLDSLAVEVPDATPATHQYAEAIRLVPKDTPALFHPRLNRAVIRANLPKAHQADLDTADRLAHQAALQHTYDRLAPPVDTQEFVRALALQRFGIDLTQWSP